MKNLFFLLPLLTKSSFLKRLSIITTSAILSRGDHHMILQQSDIFDLAFHRKWASLFICIYIADGESSLEE